MAQEEQARSVGYYKVYREPEPNGRWLYTAWTPVALLGTPQEHRAPQVGPKLGRIGSFVWDERLDEEQRRGLAAQELARAYGLIRRAYQEELAGETVVDQIGGKLITRGR